MLDQRAHDRIDSLDVIVQSHLVEHSRFEADLKKNTALTQEIADNTGELVALFKGIKGLRSFVMWATPIVVAVVAVIAYIRGFK